MQTYEGCVVTEKSRWQSQQIAQNDVGHRKTLQGTPNPCNECNAEKDMDFLMFGHL